MILVFGSINMDFIIRVPHLPEPGETVVSPEHLTAPGGKGANQAVAAARAGTRVAMAGCVGPDEFGREMVAIMNREDIDTSLIWIAERPTALAIIAVDDEGANQIVVSSGANNEARQACISDDVLVRATTVLLQREVPDEENTVLARRARVAGVRVIFNAAPAGPVESGGARSSDRERDRGGRSRHCHGPGRCRPCWSGEPSRPIRRTDDRGDTGRTGCRRLWTCRKVEDRQPCDPACRLGGCG